MSWLLSNMRRRLMPRRAGDEGGYIAAMVAICLASGLFMGAAAIAVDTGRWYTEMERVQKAADAAALGGVPYLPYDFPAAVTEAKAVAARNGFPEGADVQINVGPGKLDSQLKVTVRAKVTNSFGSAFGADSTWVSRSAVADYKAAAPIGSPCNVFGNEPASGGTVLASKPTTGSAIPTSMTTTNPLLKGCTSNPSMWAVIEGPSTDKGNGDRYMNATCDPNVATYKCDSTKRINDEYDELGYFWVVQVGPEAVNKPISVQIYDPGYVNTGKSCQSLTTPTVDNLNPYVNDGKTRYAKNLSSSTTGASFCPGDNNVGTSSGSSPPTTSFLLRHQTESLDPMQGTPIAGCNKQFKPVTSTPTAAALTTPGKAYNENLAQTFHNWYELCTFIPDAVGDYYLQARTNVTFGGTNLPNTNGISALISRNNPNVLAALGNTRNSEGFNMFSFRAVTADTATQPFVSVAGHERMPIYANATNATSTFHLIRVLPGSAGQKIQFEFFDVADIDSGSGAGTIRVVPPSDATGSITSTPFPGQCETYGGKYTVTTKIGSGLGTCAAAVSKADNNAKLGTMLIPIPPDYTCTYSEATGCWYKVVVSLSGSVNDITTWKATVIGDPVRLVE